MHFLTHALQSQDLSGEGIDIVSHTNFFFTTQGHGGPSLDKGSPPRQHERERRYIPFTHPFILTRWIWKIDYYGQMVFWDLCGNKASSNLSYRWGKTPEKPYPGNLSRPGIEPGPAAGEVRMLRLDHGGDLYSSLKSTLSFFFLSRLSWRCFYSAHS